MRTRKSMRPSLAASWTLSLGLGLFFLSDAHATTSDDPPDRVARISYIQGEVSLKPAGTTEWALTTLNRPLTTDDQLSLDHNARAELQVGSATIHLDAGAAFSFSELGDSVLQARVTDGAIHLTVRRLQDKEVIEIDTPQAAITVTKPGDYRIEVMTDGTRTLVKTYSGECEVAGNKESVRLQNQEQVTIDQAEQAVASREALTPRDEFDHWAEGRNQRFSRSASSRHVAPDVIGYEDLDGHGEWSNDADYGYVWYPRIAVGWSPYRDGHWAWVSPWGWTWVDNAPWGFAPFHYGRWAHVHNRWGWVPGPMHAHAVYAPALVAWVGGPSLSVSVAFGSHVGWFPLAPREVYVPGYHCSRRHIHNVNYANTVIINNTLINRAYVNRATHIDYRHRDFRGAVTVVSRDTFVSARGIGHHIERDRDVRDWQTQNATPAIVPDRASALGPRWNATASRVPEQWGRNASREVIVRHTPPPPRASFEQEQRAIRDNNDRPVARSDLWSSARTETTRTNRSEPGLAGASWFRDDHPRREFDRAHEEMRPSAPLTQPNSRSRDNMPREREPAPTQSRRQAESPVARQFEPQQERQWQQQRANTERPQRIERSERIAVPRHSEPTPQREQRSEPAQRQAPVEQRTEQHEQHFRGRDNRNAVER